MLKVVFILSPQVNGGFMTRVSQIEQDSWASLQPSGKSSRWTWNSMYPFMKKSETWTAPTSANLALGNMVTTPGEHGSSGPIRESLCATPSASRNVDPAIHPIDFRLFLSWLLVRMNRLTAVELNLTRCFVPSLATLKSRLGFQLSPNSELTLGILPVVQPGEHTSRLPASIRRATLAPTQRRGTWTPPLLDPTSSSSRAIKRRRSSSPER